MKKKKKKKIDKKIKGDDKENLISIESDVSDLVKLRKDYINNSSIGCLNINSLSEKSSISEKFALKLQSIFYKLMKRN